jgi:hypothetical protein
VCGSVCGVCVCVGFVMCGCFDNCVGVLVTCVLVFIALCVVCTRTVFLYCFVYVYLLLFLLSVCKDYCHRVKTQLQ